MNNADADTVAGFGEEWARFTQNKLDADEQRCLFDMYFSQFPWDRVGAQAVGADIGCGSGRWAALVAPRVGILHCVDASEKALNVARSQLTGLDNVRFIHASVDNIPLTPQSLDFAYSLGVLHHVPDTAAAVEACVRLLKKDAPFLLYLYSALETRPRWYAALWKVSDWVRRLVSRLPRAMRFIAADVIAGLVYFPLARAARWAEGWGVNTTNFPLSFYRNRSFYTMRTDALDRFGTKLEQRFSQTEIRHMMAQAGLKGIMFRNAAPFWCAVGFKA